MAQKSWLLVLPLSVMTDGVRTGLRGYVYGETTKSHRQKNDTLMSSRFCTNIPEDPFALGVGSMSYLAGLNVVAIQGYVLSCTNV